MLQRDLNNSEDQEELQPHLRWKIYVLYKTKTKVSNSTVVSDMISAISSEEENIPHKVSKNWVTLYFTVT